MSLMIQTVNIGRGVSWITEAWPYFTRNPLGWIAAIIVLFILSIVISFIPFFGSLLVNLCYPVFVGGYMLGCMAHQQGKSFEFQHIFSAFKEPYVIRLILLGGLYLLATFVVVILMLVLSFIMLGGFEIFHQFEHGQVDDIGSYATDFILLLLIFVTLVTPVIMGMWFAPAIIVTSEESVTSAILMSFNACLKNILPFTLYALLVLVLAIVAAIPLMLGYLVLLPVLSASVYVAFLDCFKSDTVDVVR